MKKYFTLIFAVCFMFCSDALFSQNKNVGVELQTTQVHRLLDDLNLYAAKADYKKYFNLFAAESTYVGTDATEIWNKTAFMEWAKPYFAQGRTWNFTSLKRNITFTPDGKYAWFDELLDTQMKLCRGSGVLEKIDGQWKIKQYVLSMTVPNELSDEVIRVKAAAEDVLISELKKK